MTNDGSYYWNDRILRVTRDATYELMVANVEIPELVEALQEAGRCPNSRRRRDIWEFCITIGVKEYKVVIGDDVVRDFNYEPCWTLIHIKPYTWT
jgi:hypothetical protein